MQWPERFTARLRLVGRVRCRQRLLGCIGDDGVDDVIDAFDLRQVRRQYFLRREFLALNMPCELAGRQKTKFIDGNSGALAANANR